MLHSNIFRSLLGCSLFLVNFVTGFVLAKYSTMRQPRPVHKVAFVLLLMFSLCSLYTASTLHFFVGLLSTYAGARLLVPGLTGGLATGKSTVASYLKRNGWTVIDADAIAKGVLKRGTPAFRQVVNVFGDVIIDPSSGDIDRVRLREVVFHDTSKRRLLNRITHPWILVTILWEVVKFRLCLWRQHVVLDIPLLFETHLNLLCGPVTVVAATEEVQLRRLVARDTSSPKHTLQSMIRCQLPLKEKVSLADIVLDNNSTLDKLFHQTKQYFRC
ncbi:uncharacterized protein LOC113146523 [Cyclospora cayetanensis]|uniref:Uncharacterized protein LOC113146523 n=1 Tax=Cyclospora cayetanensis TaxID=88456 RepID=A0A6P6RRZ7_9EIME|nr:uncharacterized protein LOC113146523 [Cyclospora cayetanensis]